MEFTKERPDRGAKVHGALDPMDQRIMELGARVAELEASLATTKKVAELRTAAKKKRGN